MSTASPGNRRASVAVTVLLVSLLIVAGGAFTGYDVLQVKQLELEAQQTHLEALRKRQPPTSAPAAAESVVTINPFLDEESFALSANALQKRVVGAIEAAQGKLNTVGVDPPITGDAELARRVSVQVSADLTNDALQKVLYQLEGETPFVFVETLSMNSSAAKETPEQSGTQTEPRLAVTMSVVGFRRKGSQ